jgi:hypothetical protein
MLKFYNKIYFKTQILKYNIDMDSTIEKLLLT